MENGLIRRHLNKLLRVLTDILYFYVNLQLKKNNARLKVSSAVGGCHKIIRPFKRIFRYVTWKRMNDGQPDYNIHFILIRVYFEYY
jgi:hypothetical protein